METTGSRHEHLHPLRSSDPRYYLTFFLVLLDWFRGLFAASIFLEEGPLQISTVGMRSQRRRQRRRLPRSVLRLRIVVRSLPVAELRWQPRVAKARRARSRERRTGVLLLFLLAWLLLARTAHGGGWGVAWPHLRGVSYYLEGLSVVTMFFRVTKKVRPVDTLCHSKGVSLLLRVLGGDDQIQRLRGGRGRDRWKIARILYIS